jgi:hypothetical protein
MSLPLKDKHFSPFDSLQPLKTSNFNLQPSTFNVQRSTLSTGIDELDRLLKGGVPRGKILEITGPTSSGKTSLSLSILAQSTGRGEITAYVDTVDSLDPKCAQAVGIDLENLLWIRCINQTKSLQRALKATDILCQAGGFGVIAIDLANSKVPLNTWFRLQRVIRGTSTVLVVISSQKATGSASARVLFLERNRSFWTSGKRSQWVRTPYFQGIESEACLLKGKSHGSVTIHCRF